MLDDQECQTLETLLRDLLKNASSLPGKTYSPVTHPNFVKRNQSRETLQYGAYVDKNRVQNASVAPLPRFTGGPSIKKARHRPQTPDVLRQLLWEGQGCPTTSTRGSSSGLW